MTEQNSPTPEQEQPKPGEGKTPEPAAPPADKKPEGEQKPGDGGKKPDDGAKPAEKVIPSEYKLKLPDGSLLSPDAIEKTAAYAKEKKLSNEEAQEVLERESATIAAYVEDQRKQLDVTTNKWAEDWKNDKEIGGAEFEKNAELAKRVIVRFGSETLKKQLNESGLGNHPEFARMIIAIGKAMADDELINPRTQPKIEKSAAEIMYPNMVKKES